MASQQGGGGGASVSAGGTDDPWFNIPPIVATAVWSLRAAVDSQEVTIGMLRERVARLERGQTSFSSPPRANVSPPASQGAALRDETSKMNYGAASDPTAKGPHRVRQRVHPVTSLTTPPAMDVDNDTKGCCFAQPGPRRDAAKALVRRCVAKIMKQAVGVAELCAAPSVRAESIATADVDAASVADSVSKMFQLHHVRSSDDAMAWDRGAPPAPPRFGERFVAAPSGDTAVGSGAPRPLDSVRGAGQVPDVDSVRPSSHCDCAERLREATARMELKDMAMRAHVANVVEQRVAAAAAQLSRDAAATHDGIVERVAHTLRSATTISHGSAVAHRTPSPSAAAPTLLYSNIVAAIDEQLTVIETTVRNRLDAIADTSREAIAAVQRRVNSIVAELDGVKMQSAAQFATLSEASMRHRVELDSKWNRAMIAGGGIAIAPFTHDAGISPNVRDLVERASTGVEKRLNVRIDAAESGLCELQTRFDVEIVARLHHRDDNFDARFRQMTAHLDHVHRRVSEVTETVANLRAAPSESRVVNPAIPSAPCVPVVDAPQVDDGSTSAPTSVDKVARQLQRCKARIMELQSAVDDLNRQFGGRIAFIENVTMAHMARVESGAAANLRLAEESAKGSASGAQTAARPDRRSDTAATRDEATGPMTPARPPLTSSVGVATSPTSIDQEGGASVAPPSQPFSQSTRWSVQREPTRESGGTIAGQKSPSTSVVTASEESVRLLADDVDRVRQTVRELCHIIGSASPERLRSVSFVSRSLDEVGSVNGRETTGPQDSSSSSHLAASVQESGGGSGMPLQGQRATERAGSTHADGATAHAARARWESQCAEEIGRLHSRVEEQSTLLALLQHEQRGFDKLVDEKIQQMFEGLFDDYRFVDNIAYLVQSRIEEAPAGVTQSGLGDGPEKGQRRAATADASHQSLEMSALHSAADEQSLADGGGGAAVLSSSHRRNAGAAPPRGRPPLHPRSYATADGQRDGAVDDENTVDDSDGLCGPRDDDHQYDASLPPGASLPLGELEGSPSAEVLQLYRFVADRMKAKADVADVGHLVQQAYVDCRNKIVQEVGDALHDIRSQLASVVTVSMLSDVLRFSDVRSEIAVEANR